VEAEAPAAADGNTDEGEPHHDHRRLPLRRDPLPGRGRCPHPRAVSLHGLFGATPGPPMVGSDDVPAGRGQGDQRARPRSTPLRNMAAGISVPTAAPDLFYENAEVLRASSIFRARPTTIPMRFPRCAQIQVARADRMDGARPRTADVRALPAAGLGATRPGCPVRARHGRAWRRRPSGDGGVCRKTASCSRAPAPDSRTADSNSSCCTLAGRSPQTAATARPRSLCESFRGHAFPLSLKVRIACGTRGSGRRFDASREHRSRGNLRIFLNDDHRAALRAGPPQARFSRQATPAVVEVSHGLSPAHCFI
jgi:hypothetical protein